MGRTGRAVGRSSALPMPRAVRRAGHSVVAVRCAAAMGDPTHGHPPAGPEVAALLALPP